MLLWTNILVHVAQAQQTVHRSRARVAVLVDQKAATDLNTNISTAWCHQYKQTAGPEII
jgi:hypothetical protein